MSWARSPRGRVHWMDTDSVGPVSRCGKWRPDLQPRPISPAEKEKCPQCVLLKPRDEPFHERDRSAPEQVRLRNAGIRAAKANNPELTLRALAERFGCTERLAWLALKRKPTSNRFTAEVSR